MNSCHLLIVFNANIRMFYYGEEKEMNELGKMKNSDIINSVLLAVAVHQ